VNRPRATNVRVRAEDAVRRGLSIDAELATACLKKSIFGQVYRQLHFLPPSALRGAQRY
jgi:hypothetical protein